MLSKLDDYPIHQTPEPLPHPATSDRNVYDRFWFNGFSRDGATYFGVAMAVYPHRQILDGAFCLVHEGVHHCFFVSGRAPHERSETRMGPLRIEIVEPLMRSRIVLEPNDTGIECDLRFDARTGVIQEKRQTIEVEARKVMDATRLTQFGRWSGTVRAGGHSLTVAADEFLGTKDRSWGVRGVGEPESGGAPSREQRSFFFLWAPLQWEDRCTHAIFFEDTEGHAFHSEGVTLPSYPSTEAVPAIEDPATLRLDRVENRLRYVPGSRRVAEAEIVLLAKDGDREAISLEPLLCFQMKGIGYGHPQWAHGRWHGELEIGSDSFRSDELDPLARENVHVQQVVRARCGERFGMGVLEYVCLGPHRPSGFVGPLDGAG